MARNWRILRKSALTWAGWAAISVGSVGSVAAMWGSGCSGTPPRPELAATPNARDDGEASPGDDSETADKPLELGPITKDSQREHPAGFAWRIDGPGQAPEKIAIGEAEARGYTVVDLGDDWVPYIFSNKTPGLEDASPNRYRETYIGLANDRFDSDGQKLGKHAHNYLELYGIPPTLTVLLEEWQQQEPLETCLSEAGYDPAVFTRYAGSIPYYRGKERRFKSPARWSFAQLSKVMRKAKLDPKKPADVAAAAEHPKTQAAYKRWRESQDPLDVITQAQIRFRCERLFERAGGRGTFKAGEFDSETTHALAAFEKKHNIMGWGHFTKENIAALALNPQEVVHARLVRSVQERVVSAAGIVEDGSAAQWQPDFRWKDAKGHEHPLRNVVEESSQAALTTLGLTTSEQARQSLAALSDLGDGGFDELLVAIKLPPPPAYYGPSMEFEAVIDRGDVWYDFPFDEEGNRLSQPRRRFPHLTLYVKHLEQRIPLIHWRTTIGSWRSELKEGEVYFKYKDSDVGPRVWKDIFAGPTWIPPASTPAEELLARKWIDGGLQTVVSYDETGPGYRSAYGLVAAFHIRQVFDAEGNIKAELDNQIRTHGSVDYMSILRRYSHGCHRLYNMNAVRMFSFILRHSDYIRHGQVPVGFARLFEHEGVEYRIKIDTRGYRYELARPIPITVTEGRIKGKRKKPYEEYKKKPGQLYDEDFEQLRELDLPTFGL